jgi:hypothetical protein
LVLCDRQHMRLWNNTIDQDHGCNLKLGGPIHMQVGA